MQLAQSPLFFSCPSRQDHRSARQWRQRAVVAAARSARQAPVSPAGLTGPCMVRNRAAVRGYASTRSTLTAWAATLARSQPTGSSRRRDSCTRACASHAAARSNKATATARPPVEGA